MPRSTPNLPPQKERRPGCELSEDQLDQVNGGAQLAAAACPRTRRATEELFGNYNFLLEVSG